MKLAETIKGFQKIISGELDALPEQAFYMAGTLDDVMVAAEKLAAVGMAQ